VDDDYEYEDENGRFVGEDEQESLKRHLPEEMKDIDVGLRQMEDLLQRIRNVMADSWM
jgi:hypothetical protein